MIEAGTKIYRFGNLCLLLEPRSEFGQIWPSCWSVGIKSEACQRCKLVWSAPLDSDDQSWLSSAVWPAGGACSHSDSVRPGGPYLVRSCIVWLVTQRSLYPTQPARRVSSSKIHPVAIGSPHVVSEPTRPAPVRFLQFTDVISEITLNASACRCYGLLNGGSEMLSC